MHSTLNTHSKKRGGNYFGIGYFLHFRKAKVGRFVRHKAEVFSFFKIRARHRYLKSPGSPTHNFIPLKIPAKFKYLMKYFAFL